VPDSCCTASSGAIKWLPFSDVFAADKLKCVQTSPFGPDVHVLINPVVVSGCAVDGTHGSLTAKKAVGLILPMLLAMVEMLRRMVPAAHVALDTHCNVSASYVETPGLKLSFLDVGQLYMSCLIPPGKSFFVSMGVYLRISYRRTCCCFFLQVCMQN
jgi:hypothetical protein